jgi:hypothetical protein
MTIKKLTAIGDSIAWHAVQALTEDAKADFKGEQGEAFAWAVYHAVRYTDAAQLQNLRELLHKRGVQLKEGEKPAKGWLN